MTYTPVTPPMPSLLDEEHHDDLRRAVRTVLDRRSGTAAVLDHIASGAGHDPATWDTLVRDVGVTSLLVPQDLGGDGGTLREAAVVMTELGRAVAPVPYLASAGLATTALVVAARAGSHAATDAVARLVDGDIGTLVVAVTSSPVTLHRPTVALHDGTLTGEVEVVLAADVADILVVPVTTDRGTELYVVTAGSSGLSVDRSTSTDETRPVSRVSFAGVEGVLVADHLHAPAAITSALESGAVMLAAEAVGLAEWAVDEAVAHLKSRHQFGRAIGSYQSLRHRAAQMWVDTGQARAIAAYAAACSAGDLEDRHVAMTLAKPYATTTALRVVEHCLQLHGGIGFTWDSGVHLRLKRALTTTVQLGTEESHHLALGRLVDLAPPEPTHDEGAS